MGNIFKEQITSDEFLFMTNLPYHKLCPAYIKVLGLTPALLLVDLMSKWTYFKKIDKIDKDGYFYNIQENIEKDTSLTAKQQRRAVEILEEKKILKIKFKGSPPKKYFKIDVKKLCLLVMNSSTVTFGNPYKRESLSLTKGNPSTVTKGYINNTNANKNKELSFSKEKEEPFSKASRIPSENPSPIRLMRRKPFIQKEVIQKSIPSDVQDILDYWIEMKLHMPRTDTRSYQNCIKKVKGLLNGRLFGKTYSIEKIQEVIMTFSFAALDPQFEPDSLEYKKRLSKTTIADFILNSFNKNGNGSLFKQYLKEPPKTLKEFTPVEDKYPTVTNLIKKTYQEKVLGTSKINYSKSDEDCFRLASNKLMEFFKENKDNLALNLNNGDKVELLFDSILKTTNENQVTITPQWLCSQKTINTRLPSWCFKQSVFQTTSQWSMYDKPIRKREGSSLLERDDEDITFPEDEDITF